MGRIRSIKPEFFTSETLASVSRDSRLLFIGLWPIADDYGCLLDIPRRILGDVFPHDKDLTDTHIEAMLVDLSAACLIVRHRLNKMAIIAICGWDEHQRVDRPGKVRICTENERQEALSRVPRETVASVSMLDLGSRIKDHGPSITSANTQPPTSAGQPPATSHSCVLYPNGQILTESPTFSRFWLAYPKKVRKSEAAEAWNASMAAGIDPEVIICGITGEPTLQAEEAKFLPKAEDWLADSRWLGGMTIAERDRIQAAKEEAAKPRDRSDKPEGKRLIEFRAMIAKNAAEATP